MPATAPSTWPAGRRRGWRPASRWSRALRRAETAELPSWQLVDDAAGLAGVVARLADEPRYAVDTEFHRERTYAPRLALLQLAWSDGCAVVDPLSVDPAPLR